MKEDAIFLLKLIVGTIIAILITFVFYPLILLDIILIPVFLIEIFFLVIVLPGRELLDFLFPHRSDSMYDDSDTEQSYNDYNQNNNNEIPTMGNGYSYNNANEISITGDHFFPRKDGGCVHQYSKVCETCARRKKSFGNYTMGYHCYM